MNSEPNTVHSTNHFDIATSTATAPAAARSTNPEAMTTRSTTATCLSHSVYAIVVDDVGGDDAPPSASGRWPAATRHAATRSERADDLGGADRHDRRRRSGGGASPGGAGRPRRRGRRSRGRGRSPPGRRRRTRAAPARARGQSSSTPAAPGAANTSRFLTHCSGRAVRTHGRRPTTPRPPDDRVRRRRPRRRSPRSPTPRGRRRRASARRRASRRRPTARPSARPPWWASSQAWSRTTLASPRQFPPSRRAGSTVRRRRRPSSVATTVRSEAEVVGERPQVDAERRRHEDDVVAARGDGDGGVGERVGTQPLGRRSARRTARPARSTLGDRTPGEHRLGGQRLDRVTVATDHAPARARAAGGPARRRGRSVPATGAGTARRSRGWSACRRRRTRRRPGGAGTAGRHRARSAARLAAMRGRARGWRPAGSRSFHRRRIAIPVGADALVLDVGSGDKPHWRADVLLDRYVGAEHGGQRSGRAAAADHAAAVRRRRRRRCRSPTGCSTTSCARTCSSTCPTRPPWSPR